MKLDRFFHQLHGLLFRKSTMDLEEILKTLHGEILAIAAKIRCTERESVRLGVARGVADEESDLDLLEELEPGTTLLSHSAIIRELERLLGRKVDVVSERARSAGVHRRSGLARGGAYLRTDRELLQDILDSIKKPEMNQRQNKKT